MARGAWVCAICGRTAAGRTTGTLWTTVSVLNSVAVITLVELSKRVVVIALPLKVIGMTVESSSVMVVT